MIVIMITFIMSILIFRISQEIATSMNNNVPRKTMIRFVRQRYDAITPDVIVKSFWVSTSLALILTIPPLTIFMTIFHNGGNLLLGAVIGFGIHFVLFALSGRISSFMTSLLDD